MSAFSLFSVCSLVVSCLGRAAPLARSQAALTIDNKGVLSSTDSNKQRPTPVARKEAHTAAPRHAKPDRYFEDFWKAPDRHKNLSAASLGQGFRRSGARGPKMSGYENNDCGGTHYSSVTLPEAADLVGDECIALRDATSDAPFGRMKIMCEYDTGIAKVCIWNTPQESSCTSNEPVCLAIDRSFTGMVSGGKCVPVKSHPNEKDAFWRFADFPPETVWPDCLVPPLATSMFGMVTMGGVCIGIIINCVIWVMFVAPPKRQKSMPPPGGKGFGFGGKGEDFDGKGFGGKGEFPGGKGEDAGGKGEDAGGKGKDFAAGKGGFGGEAFGGKGEFLGGKGEVSGGKGEAPGGKGEAPGGKGEAPGGIGEVPGGKGEAPGGKGEGEGWKGEG